MLVEQYGRLKAEIEGKMWALKELKNTEGMSNDHLNDFSTTEYSFSEWKFINFEINEDTEVTEIVILT